MYMRSTTRPTEKPSDLPLFALGAFDVPSLNPKTGVIDLSYRATNLSPEGMWGIALDYDDVPNETLVGILNRAREFSPRGVAYSTWSQGLGPADTGRVRIVMPFGDSERGSVVPASAWPVVWALIEQDIGGHADAQCKDVNRTYYLPVTNEQAPEWAQPCWFESWGSE